MFAYQQQQQQQQGPVSTFFISHFSAPPPTAPAASSLRSLPSIARPLDLTIVVTDMRGSRSGSHPSLGTGRAYQGPLRESQHHHYHHHHQSQQHQQQQHYDEPLRPVTKRRVGRL